MATSSTPAKFILSTDYATLKNDSDTITINLTVPGSQVIPGVSTTVSVVSFSATGTGGTAGSPMNVTIQYSYDNVIYSTYSYNYVTQGTVLGSPQDYTTNISVSRSAPNTFIVTASIANPYATTLTTESTSRTVTARVSTFLPPFSS